MTGSFLHFFTDRFMDMARRMMSKGQGCGT